MPNGVVAYEVAADLLARYGEPVLIGLLAVAWFAVLIFLPVWWKYYQDKRI